MSAFAQSLASVVSVLRSADATYFDKTEASDSIVQLLEESGLNYVNAPGAAERRAELRDSGVTAALLACVSGDADCNDAGKLLLERSALYMLSRVTEEGIALAPLDGALDVGRAADVAVGAMRTFVDDADVQAAGLMLLDNLLRFGCVRGNRAAAAAAAAARAWDMHRTTDYMVSAIGDGVTRDLLQQAAAF